ncbi:MAG: hypothetical protein R3B96_15190 [Pirellulaceae bacterium]
MRLPARRALQQEYNEEHGITPATIRKNIRSGIESVAALIGRRREAVDARMRLSTSPRNISPRSRKRCSRPRRISN